MIIEHNKDLTRLNTFGVRAHAKLFVAVESEYDLEELFKTAEFQNNEKLFLGGGSNVLFTRDFPGIVIQNKLLGIEILEKNDSEVFVRAMAGEIWHDLVEFSTSRGYWGIENLSLIPGSVGGAPVQNIGAYGVELKDVLINVEGYEVATGRKRIFDVFECKFGYRDSVFKQRLKGKYFITAITIRLFTQERKNINYKVLAEYLETYKIEVKTPKDVSDAVAAIRRSKLPDPKFIGNAGSFFKNIFVSDQELENLISKFPSIKYFKEGERIKVSSAWLIEQSGWKGYREGDAGVHDRQALVLVNHGTATGIQIKNLADKIATSVYEKFGLKLTPEVNLI